MFNVKVLLFVYFSFNISFVIQPIDYSSVFRKFYFIAREIKYFIVQIIDILINVVLYD